MIIIFVTMFAVLGLILVHESFRIDKIWYFLKHGNEQINEDFRKFIEKKIK